MERRLGISILMLLPEVWIWGIRFFAYDRIYSKFCLGPGLGIQVLPLRGASEMNVSNLTVLSIEGPWNTGTWWQAIKRLCGAKDCGYPSWIDMILFGDKKSSDKRLQMLRRNYPHVIAIDCPRPGFDSAIELGPEMHTGNSRQWEGKNPSGVVLDTGHYRKLGPDGQKIFVELGSWNSVKMIHLKVETPEEYWDFLQDGNHPNTDIFKYFLMYAPPGTPVVIEVGFFPWLHFMRRTTVIEKLVAKIREMDRTIAAIKK